MVIGLNKSEMGCSCTKQGQLLLQEEETQLHGNRLIIAAADYKTQDEACNGKQEDKEMNRIAGAMQTYMLYDSAKGAKLSQQRELQLHQAG
jgi:hypothetical protein